MTGFAPPPSEKLSFEDREQLADAIRDWAAKKAIFDFTFVIHPAMVWGRNMGLIASAVVTVPPATQDEVGKNLDPTQCDCGKGEACPLWDSWKGDTKWTALLREDGEIVWWEQRAML